MGWVRLANINLSRDWQFTPPVTGEVFRLRHTINQVPTSTMAAVIAQVAIEDEEALTIIDSRRVTVQGDWMGFLFVPPPGILNRALAVRRLDDSGIPWSIEIEALDGRPSVVTLPIDISDVRDLERAMQGKADTAITDEMRTRIDAKASILHTHKVADVAALDAALTMKVNFDDARLSDSRSPTGAAGGDLSGTYPNPELKQVITAGTFTKLSIDAKGRAISGSNLSANDIPNLDSAKIISGTIGAARLPLATSTEARGLAVSDKLITPQSLASSFTRSHATTGYQRIAGGLILQWGSAVVTLNGNGDGVILFPIGFSTLFAGTACNGDPGVGPASGSAFSINHGASSSTGLALSVRPSPSAINVRVNWIALGI